MFFLWKFTKNEAHTSIRLYNEKYKRIQKDCRAFRAVFKFVTEKASQLFLQKSMKKGRKSREFSFYKIFYSRVKLVKTPLKAVVLFSLKTMLKIYLNRSSHCTRIYTKDFFSKCDQIRSFLWIWSHLLKKSLMKNFIFCAVWRPIHYENVNAQNFSSIMETGKVVKKFFI